MTKELIPPDIINLFLLVEPQGALRKTLQWAVAFNLGFRLELRQKRGTLGMSDINMNRIYRSMVETVLGAVVLLLC